MTAWHVAQGLLAASLVPSVATCLRGKVEDRLVGLELASVVLVLFVELFCETERRTSFLSLPIALALLSFGSGLVFARFLERWL